MAPSPSWRGASFPRKFHSLRHLRKLFSAARPVSKARRASGSGSGGAHYRTSYVGEYCRAPPPTRWEASSGTGLGREAAARYSSASFRALHAETATCHSRQMIVVLLTGGSDVQTLLRDLADSSDWPKAMAQVFQVNRTCPVYVRHRAGEQLMQAPGCLLSGRRYRGRIRKAGRTHQSCGRSTWIAGMTTPSSGRVRIPSTPATMRLPLGLGE
jgi:hypothetical protein